MKLYQNRSTVINEVAACSGKMNRAPFNLTIHPVNVVCCRAEKSDYKVVVGRSEKVTGPYLDKNGISMFDGGGSLVVQGDGKIWYGAGHNSAYTFDGRDYMVYHGYDAADKGRSKLIIEALQWKDEWPVVPSQVPYLR